MTDKQIPPENSPIYLQRYKVHIYPEKGETKVGSVIYTTVGAIPSNVSSERVWALNLNGVLEPNVKKYRIVYDFSEVKYPKKGSISFENTISGTFNIGNRVLNASKIIGDNYTYSDQDFTLTIELDTSKLNCLLKKRTLFSYQLNINDDTTSCAQPTNSNKNSNPPNIAIYASEDNPYTLGNGDLVTLQYPQNDYPGVVFVNNNGTLGLAQAYLYMRCDTIWYEINEPDYSDFTTNLNQNNSITVWNNADNANNPSKYSVEFNLAQGSGQDLILYLL